MGTKINFALVRPMRAAHEGELMVEDVEVGASEIESVGSVVSTDLVVTEAHMRDGFTMWRIENQDSPAWITFGTSPTAAEGTTHYLPANDRRWFKAVVGHKVSVISG